LGVVSDYRNTLSLCLFQLFSVVGSEGRQQFPPQAAVRAKRAVFHQLPVDHDAGLGQDAEQSLQPFLHDSDIHGRKTTPGAGRAGRSVTVDLRQQCSNLTPELALLMSTAGC
jgi:hypothetical protein